MSEEIKIDIGKLEEAIEKLRNGMSLFGDYSDAFIHGAAEDMDRFQSDFTEKMSRLLGNMTDTKAPVLKNNTEVFIHDVELLKQGFEDTDHGIEAQMKEKSGE